MLGDKNIFVKLAKLNCTVAMLLLMSACAATVTINNQIPVPLVEKLPLNAHLLVNDEFKQFVYQENDKKRQSTLKSFDMSVAQVETFRRSFSAILYLVPVDAERIDLTIEPELIDFQYSAPGETRLKHYEVWLKYRLKVSDSEPKQFADWIIKGYGKTPSGLFMGNSEGFTAAADVALRDVGAQIATRLPKQDAIKSLLRDKTNPPEGDEEDGLAESSSEQENEKEESE